VLNNARDYKKQASNFLKFGFGGAELKYNSKWLAKISFEELLKLSSHLTHSQIIKRSMFQERLRQDKDIYLNEFLYPLMQGYDSVFMDVDGEIGGNDQTFNMLVGRDLQKKIKNKEKFVITTKLLADANGDKMGKTTGNMVALNVGPSDMFGKVMSWTDGMILSGFELCTFVSLEEIAEIKNQLESGINPKDIKMRLGYEIVKIYHGDKEALKAKENFINTFKKGGLPENIEEVKAISGELLSEKLVAIKAVASKGEFRRLVLEGAVSDAVSGEKITDPNYKISKEITLRVGKKRFVKLVV